MCFDAAGRRRILGVQAMRTRLRFEWGSYLERVPDGPGSGASSLVYVSSSVDLKW